MKKMIKKGDKVSFHGHKLEVETIYEDGNFVDLLDESIPFLPVRVIHIPVDEIKPIN